MNMMALLMIRTHDIAGRGDKANIATATTMTRPTRTRIAKAVVCVRPMPAVNIPNVARDRDNNKSTKNDNNTNDNTTIILIVGTTDVVVLRLWCFSVAEKMETKRIRSRKALGKCY